MSSVFGGGRRRGAGQGSCYGRGGKEESLAKGVDNARHNRLVMRCADKLFLGWAAGQCVAGPACLETRGVWRRCADVSYALVLPCFREKKDKDKDKDKDKKEKKCVGDGGTHAAVWQSARFCDVAVSCPGAHALLTAPASWYAV